MSHVTHVITGGGEIKQMVDLYAVIIYTTTKIFDNMYIVHYKSFHEYFPKGIYLLSIYLQR